MAVPTSTRITTPSGAPRSPSARLLRWLRWSAVATLVVNIGIVLTGGVVRLTGSGLGCPTWPECGNGSYVPHRALGVHGAIEFSNRMLTFAVGVVVIATLVLAWRVGRPSVTRLAGLIVAGVPAQAVIGGISVLTDLNPWVVSIHLMVSMGMVALSVLLLRRVGEGDGPAVPTVPASVQWLSRGILVVGWAVLYLGTVVTGSGPHAGDLTSPRNGLDPRSVTQAHADLVFLLVGLTVALVVVVGTTGAPALVRRAAGVLLVVELAQGLIGFVQYLTDLPVVLVAFHLLGSSLVSAAMTWVLVAGRERTAAETSVH